MPPEVVLKFFAQYIESELGIVYAEHNYFQLQNRLEEISKFVGVDSVEKLFEEAQKSISGSFRQMLLDVATNNETSFFRDPKVFNAIENIVLPKYCEGKSLVGPLKVWSAASSTGQEALSTAIMINEWNQKHKQNIDFSITGTDISERVLLKAKSGQYSQLEVQRGLPMPLLVKYFKKDDSDRWKVEEEILHRIHYSKLNLKSHFHFPEKFDIVFCRNVLIYQSLNGKIEILKRITANLADGGFLIMGSGESLLGLSEDYKQAPLDNAVLYQKISKQQRAA